MPRFLLSKCQIIPQRLKTPSISGTLALFSGVGTTRSDVSNAYRDIKGMIDLDASIQRA